MAYSELIKNFDHIRSYMRDFFLFGFKTRDEYDKKSARSYDNEKRRIQSYLGDLVTFKQSTSGKNVFISLDGRSVTHNPLYKAFKSKSFTNKDITLHFIVMDILSSGEAYTLKELLGIIGDEYLSSFEEPISFDESTLRKKLKEYEELGFVVSEKQGRMVTYKIVEDTVDLEQFRDAIRFFTEENPLGVVGSYLEDKIGPGQEYMEFKNHYLMNAYDTEIIEKVMQGIHEKRVIRVINYSPRSKLVKRRHVIPMKLYISTQGGRNYLLCMGAKNHQMLSFRMDYIQDVLLEEECPEYDEVRENFLECARHIWGVSFSQGKEPEHMEGKKLEHIEMDIQIKPYELFMVRRLEREKRCGQVVKLDEETYRFSADVYEAFEMVPWIRTFIGRITGLRCEDKRVIEQLKQDILELAKEYGEGE